MTERIKAVGSRVDQLMESATAALTSGRYAEAERLAQDALQEAHQASDYERMARVLLPLEEARRLRRQEAADVKKVHRIKTTEELEAYLTGNKAIKPGCYLLEPPALVGNDGRELRERALAEDVSAFVIVHEPKTRLNKWPIVAVGPEIVRTFVDPPKRIDVQWMMQTGEALGDYALAGSDPAADAAVRAERLFDLLATVMDHDKMHQALMDACNAAHAEILAAPPKKRGRPQRIDDDDFVDEEEAEASRGI